jgi:2-polyprenyl-3-methyl-5-hydroxy-6-metoxy-1,4-benzoquinol methylase
METEKRGVKDFFDQTGLYLHKRFGIQLRREIIKKLVPATAYKRVLDVGCGDGTLSLDFIEKADHVAMIDLSDNMLILARQNIRYHFPEEDNKIIYFNGDFISFEENNPFDLILLIGVLAHVPDIGETFMKVSSLLKPNGVVVIQFSDSNHLLIRLRLWLHRRKSKYELNKITKGNLEVIYNQNNLKCIGEKKFNFPFFGMKYFSDRSLLTFQHWMMKKKWLSFLLSDVILILEKK